VPKEPEIFFACIKVYNIIYLTVEWKHVVKGIAANVIVSGQQF